MNDDATAQLGDEKFVSLATFKRNGDGVVCADVDRRRRCAVIGVDTGRFVEGQAGST